MSGTLSLLLVPQSAGVLPGATSLAVQCCDVAVAMDMSKYVNNIIEPDPERDIART